MKNIYFIFFIIILVIFSLIILLKKQKKYEFMETETTTSLTDIDIEALQNLSSMYNSGTVTVPNIKVTGDIDITGGIKANTLDVTSGINTNTLDVTSDLNVSGTTKTSGATYSKYYVVNNTAYDYSFLSSLGKLLSNGTAAGIIYPSDTGKLGIKLKDHLYITTYSNSDMIDIYGDTVDYYPNTKGSGKSGITN